MMTASRSLTNRFWTTLCVIAFSVCSLSVSHSAEKIQIAQAPSARKAAAPAKARTATSKPASKKTAPRSSVLGKPESKTSKKKQAPYANVPAKTASPSKPKKARSTVLGKLGTGGTRKKSSSPLGDLIKNIFGTPSTRRAVRRDEVPSKKTAKKDKQTANGLPKARDAIDALAPYNPDHGKLLQRANDLIAEKDWEQAMLALRYLVDPRDLQGHKRPLNDSLFRTKNNEWISVISEANRLIGTFPPDWLGKLRLQFDAEAKQQLLDAVRNDNISNIAEIATRYFHTNAGQQAANRLGSYHFDRGEFGIAARWYRELLRSDSALTKKRQWQIKSAFAFRRAGDTPNAEKVLAVLASTGSSLKLGIGQIEPKTWLQQQAIPETQKQPDLEEWAMFMGTSSRTGTLTGDDPLLLTRWTHPTTYRRPLKNNISILMDDLADQGKAIIPAFFPLMIDGKVIFRTLRGVQVVDASSGQSLWESREGISAERLLSGEKPQQPQTPQQAMFMGGGFMTGMVPASPGNNSDLQPLTSLLYRDGLNGILSSDGERVFVIEDHAILSQAKNQTYSPFGSASLRNDPYRRDFASNRLAAYRLQSGRPVWDVGGKKMNEPFDAALAGTYFLGAPVPDGNDLFVVGEQDNEIRLYNLDPSTGLMKWSQLIAYSDTRIDQEFGRRLWTAQVSVGNGIIICPTTVGWLIAVDRLNHSVLWAYRYTRPGKQSSQRRTRQPQMWANSPSANQVQPGSLNSRWTPSAPVIVGNRVIYAPSEDGNLVCLSLFDGKILWKKPKSRFLYLAGIFNNQVTLVGKDQVAAFAIQDGNEIWKRKIPAADGPPSGTGTAADGIYYLPLQSGQLWNIDLKKGTVLSKSYLPDNATPLGNVAMYRGTLLSLNPLAMTSFEQRKTITAEISKRKAANPLDPWALLKESNIHILNRKYTEALALMRNIQTEALSAELTPQYRKAMIETLTAIVRTDFQKHARELEELKRFVKSDEEQLAFSRLKATRHSTLKEYQAAFDVYQHLSAEHNFPENFRVTRNDDPDVTISFPLWLSGKMKDLWSRMTPENRNPLNASINKSAQAALKGELSAREHFVVLYEFHPSALAVQKLLIEDYAASGKSGRAEILLLKLSKHANPEERKSAFKRLAQLMDDAGLKRDAEYYSLLSNKGSASTLTPEKQTAGWGQFDLTLSRSASRSNYGSSRQSQSLDGIPSQLPFYAKHRFFIEKQRLAVTNSANEALHWLLPLRSAMSGSQSNFYASRSIGHQIYLIHRDILHCLSPVDRQVLWTHPVDTRKQAGSYYRQPTKQALQPMQNGTTILSQKSLSAQASIYGMQAAVIGDYVCLHGRRRITMFDAATGKIRWEKNNIKHGTLVHGSDNIVYIMPSNRSDAVALRVLDGKIVQHPEVFSLLKKTVHISENSLILIEANSGNLFGFARRKAIIRKYNPLTKQDEWKIEFPNGTYLSLLDRQTLAVLTPSHQVELVNLEKGTRTPVGKPLSDSDVKSRNALYMLADQNNLYLIINQNRNRRSSMGGSSQIPSFYVNGKIIAFNRNSGKLLWKQDVPNQQLIYQDLNQSPVLLFSSRDYDRNLRYMTANILAIDKKSGRRLLEKSMPSNGFYSMNVNLPERHIELRSYNTSVRLKAVDKKASAK